MAGVAKIPDELSDYVEDFQRRMNNPLEQAKRLSEIASMLGLGIATILKRYAVGKRRLGHYSKRRKELGLDMQAADLLGFALSTISKPIAASIDLTFDCNYGCGECFKHVLKTLGKPTPEIDDESYLERFRYVQETFSGVPTFIMGGEPFLKPKRLVEVLKIAEEYAVPVILGSNFSIDIVETARINKFYEELLHILKSHKNKIAVWCSLEDTVSEHHDLLRKQGGFDLSIRNAKNLMESGIPVTANLFINAQNYPRFQQMLDYLMGMGFEGAAVHFHTYVFNAKNPFPQYTLTESHREKASKVLEKVLKEKHYFDFTRGMTSESARMFHPGYLSKVFNVKKCPTANRMLSFDHRMLPLIPCSFGGEVYCNYDHPEHGKIGCGLWLPALYAAAVRGGVGAIRSLMTEAFSRNK